MCVFVDSNVILDVATEDTVWCAWSASRMTHLGNQTVLVINALVYAEVSVRYETIEEVEGVLAPRFFRREALPFEAAFLAGKAFRSYRRRGGSRQSPMPDFYIGAHAAVRGHRLLTRDPRRYRSYFPTVELIAPDV